VKMGREKSHGRAWTAEERLRHSHACRSKVRLTHLQKLEIIRLAESQEGGRLSQADLAVLFNKVISVNDRRCFVRMCARSAPES
jgi:hypothetical protein